MFNASLFDFENTEDNKLASAGGSEFLLAGVSFYNGVYRDLLIHAEHANGTRANLTDDVVMFWAAYQGKMLVIQLLPYGSVNLRLYVGRMENSVWRPDALPWTVLTFMDLDSGQDWTTFERLHLPIMQTTCVAAKCAIALEFEDKQDFLASYQNLA